MSFDPSTCVTVFSNGQAVFALVSQHHELNIHMEARHAPLM